MVHRTLVVKQIYRLKRARVDDRIQVVQLTLVAQKIYWVVGTCG